MILFIAILVIVIVAALLYADHKWRQWMAARKREHLDDTQP